MQSILATLAILPTALLNGCRPRCWSFCVMGSHSILLHHCNLSGKDMCEQCKHSASLFWNGSQSLLMQYRRSLRQMAIRALCSRYYSHHSSPAWPAIPYPDFCRDFLTIPLQPWDHHTHPAFSLLFPPQSAWACRFSHLCERWEDQTSRTQNLTLDARDWYPKMLLGKSLRSQNFVE